MSEPNNIGEKTLSVTPTKTLSLKRPAEQGTVRQSFSHGRTKQVVVEKVKQRRILGPGEAGRDNNSQPAANAAPAPAPAAPQHSAPRPVQAPAQSSSGLARPVLS